MQTHQLQPGGMVLEDDRLTRAILPKPVASQAASGTGSAIATCIEIMRLVKAGRDPIEVCQSILDEMAGTCCQ